MSAERSSHAGENTPECDKNTEGRPSLTLTGERTLPGVWHENYWFRRHEAAYLALVPYCRGARVLDAGCGEGYGAELLRTRAGARVVALDLDPVTVAHAARAYPAVPAVRGNLAALPFRPGSFDVVASLQVVEHLWDQPAFAAECVRVLRPGGTLFVTTPNRLTFTPGGCPVNPFHIRELDPRELAGLLAPFATVTRLLGLHHGPRIRAWEGRYSRLADAQLAHLDRPPEQWPQALQDIVRGVTADDFAITDDPGELDRSLDLIAVARAGVAW